jgi:signal transduction histidine kinase/ligand-binding sensor domain-containing protein
MNFRSLALVTAVAFLSSAAAAGAAPVPSAFSDYRITSWTGGDGIMLGEIRSIAQDRDGYLWLASDGGLVRFDGFHFATADIVSGTTPLPHAPTRAVHVARDGSLWVGYNGGHGIYQIVRGDVHQIYLRNEIPGFVNVITEDRLGTLWVGHDDGLWRFRDGRWAQIPLPFTGNNRIVRDIHEDRSGVLWVATTGGLYRRVSGDTFEPSPDGEGRTVGLSQDANGRLWTTDSAAGFRRADSAERNHLFEARGMDLFHDSRGNLWVTTVGQGIWEVQNEPGKAVPTVRHATVQTGLVNDENSVILEDRDGNIWVGSIQGLTRFTPNRAMSIVDLGVVRALTLGNDGTAWAGTTTGLVALTGVTPHSRGRSRVVSSVPVHALHTALDGTVWAATDDGLHKIVGGHLQPVILGGLRLRQITAMASDRNGVLWVCDDALGLVRIAGGRIEPLAAATAGISAKPVLAQMDRADRLWIAFEGGIVRVLDPSGRVTQYGRQEGLAQTVVRTIHQDRWGDIWIGGDGGVSRLRGNHFQTLSFPNEVPRWRLPVGAIMDDDAGDLWIAFAFFGFIRVDHSEISGALNGASTPRRYHVYNSGDGAGYPDMSYGGSSGHGRDGSLWFLSSRGITVIDPQELRVQDGPIAGPRIEGITANDRRYAPTAGVALPPRTNRVRIDYAVVNLSSSSDRIRFRYRLDGFDTDWVDGTGPRQALYTNLPPGAYSFRLQASSNAMTWNEADATWTFSIEPMFYQTGWFFGLCLVAVGLCAVGAWQFRMRQVRKEVAAVFGERIRLGREIHDTLLQSLVGIALQLDSASHQMEAAPSRARTQLVSMRRQIEEYIRETRQSIWDLRSPALDRHGLIGALRATGDRLTAGKARFTLAVTGTPRSCPPNIETHILRIGHEAVMNAIRHGEARHVQMEIGFDERLLRLRVVDDGCGFNADQLSIHEPSNHYGLTGMKERAADVGGRCIIESMPGSGARVMAEFPLAPTG